ncbi:5'(3')-deoxyribonucleotidase, cytosolic type-like [Argonauta hians]
MPRLAGTEPTTVVSPPTPSQKKLIVLVDMDMVLCDFEAYFLQKYREKYPTEPYIPLEERSQFYIREQYATLRQDLSVKCREIYCAEGFFLNIPEIPGAIAAVEEMKTMDNLEVFICTSPLIGNHKYCVREKYEWVENHLGSDWSNRIIMTPDKTVVSGHLLIDDKPHIKGAMKHPSWKHILFSACHNKNITLHESKKRLENWLNDDWKKLICEYKKKHLIE